MSLLGVLLLGVVLLLSLAYLFLRSKHNYWRSRGFPCKPSPSLLYGQMQGNGTTRHAAYVTQEIYRYAQDRGERYMGYSFFFMPIVLVCDIELVKTVLVKDFAVFHDRGMYSNPQADPLSGNLFSLEGHEWRALRQKLTPTFTSGRMKQMFGTMLQVATELHRHLLGQVDRELEMKAVLARFTTDVIGTCAFGIECNTLRNPEDSDFLKYGRRVFEHRMLAMVKMTFAMLFRAQAVKLGVKVTDDDVEAFFMNLVHDTVEHRERNGVQRNDFLNLLLQIKNKGCLEEQEQDGSASADRTGISAKHSLNFSFASLFSAPRNPAQVSAARNDAAHCGTGLHHTRHPARHTAPCRGADPGVRHTSRPCPLSRAGVLRSGPLLGGSVPEPDTVQVSAIRRGAPSVHRYAVRHDAGEGGAGEHAACVPLPPNGTHTGPHRVRSEIVHTLTCGG
uniref:Uncharacterized protein n=1 Tax=Anopheles merus TaxID=30066 RepID=A0A182VPJ5_ANOME